MAIRYLKKGVGAIDVDEAFEKITGEDFGGRVPEDGYYSLVLYDKDLETWLVRLHTNGKVEFNRAACPDWKPDEFAQRFLDVLEKVVIGTDIVAEPLRENWEKEIAKIKEKMGYKHD